MRKAILVGIGVLLAGSGFGVGAFVQSRHPVLSQASGVQFATSNRDSLEKVQNAMTELSKLEYPGSKELFSNQGGALCHAVCTTPDDLEKVAKHYGNIPLAGFQSGVHGGDSFNSQEGRRFEWEGYFSDSGAVPDGNRPVRLGFKVRDTNEATVIVVLSRADGEKLTHIAIVYIQR